MSATSVENIAASLFKGKKVLITGGLGFIGSNLAIRCLELGADVSIYDNLDQNSGGRISNIDGFRSSVRLGFHDLLNFEELIKYAEDQDIVFNCAASTSHPFSMREPWLNLDANSRGVINMLEVLRKFNPEARFVHVGTTTQFGKLQYRPADELHPEFPTDIYSANKCVSEKYVLIYATAYGMRNTVIRLPNVYGPRASIHSPEFTFNNYFVGLALQNKDITVYGEGSQLRNSIYVEDAVNALTEAASANHLYGQTYLAVHEEHFSVAQIAEATVKNIGSGQVKYVDWPHGRKNIEIGDAVMTNKKIEKALGWAAKYSLDDGLALTGEYYRPRLKSYLG